MKFSQAQIHLHIFNLAHWIQRKIDTLKKEETHFETNINLCNKRFDKIKTWEWLSESWESHDEKLLLTSLGESALVNNLLEYLYTAKILFVWGLKL